MKKLLLALGLVLLMALPARAEIDWNKIISKLEWHQGIAYSMEESAFNIMSTFKIAEWKDYSLSAGYAGDAEKTNSKAILNFSGSLLKLKDYVEIPILDLVELEPGIWAGVGNINLKEMDESEFDWGVSVSLINLHF